MWNFRRRRIRLYWPFRFQPIGAVAEKYAGKHLVNVCSVQRKTNEACLKNSQYVTGIHPMFGAKSPKEGRTCIVTRTCDKSADIIRLFEKIGAEIVTHVGDKKIDGAVHDEMMRRTHVPVLAFGELAALDRQEQAAGHPLTTACRPRSNA